MQFFIEDIWLFIRGFIGMIGVLTIFFGAVRSLYQFFMLLLFKTFNANYIRLQFGNSIIMGLEFMVGSDIIGSLVAPTYYKLGLLVIIVLIRSWLSYFLSRELEALTPGQREHVVK